MAPKGSAKNANARQRKAAAKAAHKSNDSTSPDNTGAAPTSSTPSSPPAIPTTSHTHLPPQPESTSSVVVQPLDNLLEMIRPQREALLEGPSIVVYVGAVAIEGIAKRAAMATSSVLQRHFTTKPELREYHFAKGFLHPDAVRLLLIGWMQETCREFEAHAVPMQPTFEENVALIRATHFLGMHRYTEHIRDAYMDYLKNQLPTYDEILVVEQNATSDKDRLWKTMVNHLCHDRHKGLIPDPEDFAAFLEEHSRLKEALASADAFFSARAQQNWEATEEERRKRWERNQAAKSERLAHEKHTTESLKQKMDTNSSGLMVVSADEAAMLRGRKGRQRRET